MPEADKLVVPMKNMPIDGTNLINDPRFNKQCAFTKAERERLGLNGLFPDAVEDLEENQLKREMANLDVLDDNLHKYVYLQNLLDRNVTLFYKVLTENIQQFMPLVYTPTVGRACQEYHKIFTKPRGLYISIQHKNRVYEVLKNWPVDDVKAIVFTDGERILGLGDLGTNGMGIPVGKLQLYSACAGIPHHQCLPVCLDVGTNTEKYLNDPLYLGVKKKRNAISDSDYTELVVEFMHAAQSRWGRTVLLQFEDFGNRNAFHLLEATQNSFTVFNDDIQGTAAVSLGGVLASLRVKDVPNKLKDHRIIFLGAGEAGTGIANLIAYAKTQEDPNLSIAEARKNIWLVDSTGLVYQGRSEKRGPLAEHKASFAHSGYSGAAHDFVTAVKTIKPTLLIGVSGTPQAFTPEVLGAMASFNKKPLIFALSNPTSKAECTAEQAYKATNYKCIFASGSPFDPVPLPGNTSKTLHPGQGNNAYIFPGLALGVITSGACRVPEELMYVCATSLAGQVKNSDFKKGSLYPPLENIKEVSFQIACEVAERAYEMGIATSLPKPQNLPAFIEAYQDQNNYKRYA